MRTFTRLFLAIFCGSSGLFAGIYQDRPIGLVPSEAQIVVSYEEQARAALSHFDREFSSPGKRAFFIVTKLYKGDFY